MKLDFLSMGGTQRNPQGQGQQPLDAASLVKESMTAPVADPLGHATNPDPTKDDLLFKILASKMGGNQYQNDPNNGTQGMLGLASSGLGKLF